MDECESTVQLYTPAMMAQTLGISVRAIRLWHRCGLIQSCKEVMKIPYFDFSVLSTANTFAQWMNEGLTAQSIARQLIGLSNLWGRDPKQLVYDLPVSLEGKRLVLSTDSFKLEADGQLRFCFDEEVDTEDAEPVTFSFHSATGQAIQGKLRQESPDDVSDKLSQLLEDAMDAEDQEELEKAAQLYRIILATFGPNADVCFQLAEVLYRQADLGGARERYYAAVELDPGLVEARANLGCVLVELEQVELAIAEFEVALQQYPEYADVHFHLARSLDMRGQYLAAAGHWQEFLRLAPASPWSDEALARLADQPVLELSD